MDGSIHRGRIERYRERGARKDIPGLPPFTAGQMGLKRRLLGRARVAKP